MPRLVDTLRRKDFEAQLTVFQHFYYAAEYALGHRLLRRDPPRREGAQLLHLGCGPYHFPGWVNADGYALKRYIREPAFRPDWMLDITRPWRCGAGHWDGIFTEHVLEQVTYSGAVNALEESFRTLKPGAWLRVSLPDLAKHVGVYNGSAAAIADMSFPHPALAVAFLTHMHLHMSCWDADLLAAMLREIGFVDVATCSYRVGSDPRLLQDDVHKISHSFYVEGRKPAAS